MAELNSAVTAMENPHMWEYWKEKRGSPSEALEADYPILLKTDWRLQTAVRQIKDLQGWIDKIMKEEATAIHETYTFESDGLSGILGQPFGNCGG